MTPLAPATVQPLPALGDTAGITENAVRKVRENAVWKIHYRPEIVAVTLL